MTGRGSTRLIVAALVAALPVASALGQGTVVVGRGALSGIYVDESVLQRLGELEGSPARPLPLPGAIPLDAPVVLRPPVSALKLPGAADGLSLQSPDRPIKLHAPSGRYLPVAPPLKAPEKPFVLARPTPEAAPSAPAAPVETAKKELPTATPKPPAPQAPKPIMPAPAPVAPPAPATAKETAPAPAPIAPPAPPAIATSKTAPTPIVPPAVVTPKPPAAPPAPIEPKVATAPAVKAAPPPLPTPPAPKKLEPAPRTEEAAKPTATAKKEEPATPPPTVTPPPQQQAALTPPSLPLRTGEDGLLGSIGFQAGAYALSAADEKQLKEISEQVAGGTDRLQVKAYAGADGGSASAARRLSLNRALAVRSFLIAQGIRSTRIDVRALGIAEQGPPDRVDLLVIKRP